MIYVIQFGGLDMFFFGMTENDISFKTNRRQALTWSNLGDAWKQASRLNALYETAKFAVEEM